MTFQFRKFDPECFIAVYAGSLEDEVAAADLIAREEGGTETRIRARANRMLSDLLLGRFKRSDANLWLSDHEEGLYRVRPIFHRNKTAQEVEIRIVHPQLAHQFEQRFCGTERQAA
jgi:hypothetical protein